MLFIKCRSNLSMQASLSFATAGLQHGCAPHSGKLIRRNRRLERVEGGYVEVFKTTQGAPAIYFLILNLFTN